ncbi:MAG: YIP1 family protein [Actinomycetota bacterium]|nr:YIP1 family protein [Actinomycetota bacterium]
MQSAKAPEFSLHRPLPSALATIRAVLFSPRTFFSNLPADGPLKEPALFALLVGTVTGVLGAVVALVSNALTGGVGADDLRAAVVEGLLFAVLSPVGVAVAAGLYLLSIRTFVGNVADFPQAYRIVAYAFAAFVFAWIPVLGSIAISYALLVLMGIAIREVYEASFLTAVITTLVGFIPVGSALVWITAVALTS